MITKPKQITIMLLEVVVLPNGEVIHQGKTVGWIGREIEKYLREMPKENN